MAQGYSTDSDVVAATFAAMELTKLILDRLRRGDLVQEIKDVDQIFKGVYASTRGAQIGQERNQTMESFSDCSRSGGTALGDLRSSDSVLAART